MLIVRLGISGLGNFPNYYHSVYYYDYYYYKERKKTLELVTH